jgi:hypothetical protein
VTAFGWAGADRRSDPFDRLRHAAHSLGVRPEDLIELLGCQHCDSSTFPSRSEVGPVIAEVHHEPSCPDRMVEREVSILTEFHRTGQASAWAWIEHTGGDD